ncbi:MAG: hypothetical protein NVS3B20_17510 [Polyangiales bacterium]
MLVLMNDAHGAELWCESSGVDVSAIDDDIRLRADRIDLHRLDFTMSRGAMAPGIRLMGTPTDRDSLTCILRGWTAQSLEDESTRWTFAQPADFSRPSLLTALLLPDCALADEFAEYRGALRRNQVARRHGREVTEPQRPLLARLGKMGALSPDALIEAVACIEHLGCWRRNMGYLSLSVWTVRGREYWRSKLEHCLRVGDSLVEVDHLPFH